MPLDEVAQAAEIGRDGAPDAYVAAGRNARRRPARHTSRSTPRRCYPGRRCRAQGQAVEHRSCRCVQGSTGRHHGGDRQARLVDDGMGLCRQSRTGTAKGVLLAPCRRRHADGLHDGAVDPLSRDRLPAGERLGDRQPDPALSNPLSRLSTVVDGPSRDGRPRQDDPVRGTQNMPPRPRRSSARCHPGGASGRSGSMTDHSTSLRSYRATINLATDETLRHLRGAFSSLDRGFGASCGCAGERASWVFSDPDQMLQVSSPTRLLGLSQGVWSARSEGGRAVLRWPGTAAWLGSALPMRWSVGMGPHAQRRPDEAFGLAVGARRVGPCADGLELGVPRHVA